MVIQIKLNEKEILIIQFGRNQINRKSIYLISIIKETYTKNYEIEYAKFIKGFLKQKKKKQKISRKIKRAIQTLYVHCFTTNCWNCTYDKDNQCLIGTPSTWGKKEQLKIKRQKTDR